MPSGPLDIRRDIAARIGWWCFVGGLVIPAALALGGFPAPAITTGIFAHLFGSWFGFAGRQHRRGRLAMLGSAAVLIVAAVVFAVLVREARQNLPGEPVTPP